MSSFVSKKAAGLTPYTAGEQPKEKTVKLNTNENPYPPSPAVEAAVRGLELTRLRLYPDLECRELKRAIAEKEGVSSENVFVGNGSDEVLGFAFLALFDSNALPVLFPDITYSFYPVYCRLFDIAYRTIPLRADFTLDLNDYAGCDCGGAVLANPNAPTALALDREELKRFIAGFNRPVLVDEAYIDFARQKSLADEIKNLPNLLVVKTLSKSYSLAGLRCGYALGSAELIDALVRVKDSFNSYPVDMICQAAAAAAIKDEAYHARTVQQVKSTRDCLRTELQGLGARVADSQTNFLFARFPGFSGETLLAGLKEKGILVRRFSGERIKDFLRITVGTDEESALLTQALAALTRSSKK